MSRTAIWLTPVLALGLLASPRVAEAQQLQQFNDRAAFNAAAGSQVQNHDFEELTDDQPLAVLSYGRAVFRSVEGTEQDLKAYSPDSLPFPQVRSRSLFSNWNHNPMVVDFEPAVTAFGADVLQVVSGDGLVVTVEGSEGTQTFPVSFAEGGPAFVGFVASSGNVHRVSIANPAGVQQFVGVDNVAYGDAPQQGGGSDLSACFDRLEAAIHAGVADGTIVRVGGTLEQKAKMARSAAEGGRTRIAARKLAAMAVQVRLQRGRRIATARADELMALIRDCLAALSG